MRVNRILRESSYFKCHRTVNSPWCICQAGRGRGRFLDGPYESFQWWSPALLSAHSSLPAPVSGSPSSSCYGHFEQLKENKGLGLASTMTCKLMSWSSILMWMSSERNQLIKRQHLKDNQGLCCWYAFFWLLSRDAPHCQVETLNKDRKVLSRCLLCQLNQ